VGSLNQFICFCYNFRFLLSHCEKCAWQWSAEELLWSAAESCHWQDICCLCNAVCNCRGKLYLSLRSAVMAFAAIYGLLWEKHTWCINHFDRNCV